MMCPVMSGSDKIMSQCKSDRQLIRIFHVRLYVPKIIVHFFLYYAQLDTS